MAEVCKLGAEVCKVGTVSCAEVFVEGNSGGSSVFKGYRGVQGHRR